MKKKGYIIQIPNENYPLEVANIDGFKMDKEYDDVVFGYWGDTYISVNKEDYERFIGEK